MERNEFWSKVFLSLLDNKFSVDYCTEKANTALKNYDEQFNDEKEEVDEKQYDAC